MKAPQFHIDYRPTGRGASYSGYTERVDELWVTCGTCGWSYNMGRGRWTRERELDSNILSHRIEHLEEALWQMTTEST